MDEAGCLPVIVEGDWGTSVTKTVKNKLHIYFQSRKKSGGGECRVEAEDGAQRAAVFFESDEARQRVLARDDHHVTLGNQTVKLRLISTGSVTSDDASDIGPAGGDVEATDSPVAFAPPAFAPPADAGSQLKPT
ncbi:poly [ADP-ribose] polymerase 14-like [Cynoglossus semilaevis]|uniref:poly [ADP-ribose] polymerase 14-like n=1 Tax=Cynoglossus semilaevis TaxID=244447 RepID=UPI000496D051|nr:poly [ADP-ribose] polymerase 14-like [Cynoglossus semilaevis]